MPQRGEIFDLGKLGLSSGEGRRFELEVPIEPLALAGQDYGVESGSVDAVLDLTRTSSGYALRLRFAAKLEGPCFRCLEPADLELDVDAREIDQPGEDEEELASPYVDGDEVDLRSWARDALALALPLQIVCKADCLGLCAICGENLNEAGPEHVHEKEPDPRWAALKDLKLD